jgi:hypothetical protein
MGKDTQTKRGNRMTDIKDDLAVARVARETNNTKVKPTDLLRAMIHDIETGELEVDGLLLLYALRPENARWTYGAYRSGMTRDQEVVTLAVMNERVLREWRGSE